MNIVIQHIKDLFDFSILVTCILIGVFLLLVDAPKLGKQKYMKESSLAKIIGYVYIFGSIVVFIAFNIF